MSKVITFSTVFPKCHPKEGLPTDFVRKFLVGKMGKTICSMNFGFDAENIMPKYHTIRSGKRFKEGELFSPRIWSGIPYRSKQTIIAPDTRIVKIHDIERDEAGVFDINGKYINDDVELSLANNDGLELFDFLKWFEPYGAFKGQIICWKEIYYNHQVKTI
jgi:hypothetical protein